MTFNGDLIVVGMAYFIDNVISLVHFLLESYLWPLTFLGKFETVQRCPIECLALEFDLVSGRFDGCNWFVCQTETEDPFFFNVVIFCKYRLSWYICVLLLHDNS